jgi:ATP-dependent helicase Lhr and Lhr-like helicase
MSSAVLGQLDPLTAEWFASRFATVTEPQQLGWPRIQAGDDVLISAPTGSGKTLAAFLICLDGLVRRAKTGELPDSVQAIYVSPLRALSNDVRQNLEIPLAGIAALAESKGIDLAPIRNVVRTGDTSQSERQRMSRTPPHILVTTPESLYILLTSAKARDMLRTVRTVIVDEIHALADDKRGSHLSLSIARLEHLADQRPQRIGLSATVKPIEEVARFLSSRAEIVNAGHRRTLDLAVEVPRDELGPVASNELWGETYDRLAELIRQHRSTLIFVNTRRLSERVTHNLQERLREGAVVAHHGSLSAKLRHDAERRLKHGEVNAVVATASLELGIDIGFVDLVCQIGTPRSISVTLQRVGRSGHWLGAIPKGRLFPTTRDELIECAALVRSIRSGDLDKLEIPEQPLDILAQQIVAAAAGDDWREDALYDLMRSAYPYRNLARKDFDEVLAMLSAGYNTSRGRSGAYLHRDEINHRVRGRRGARLAAITSGGAIPDNANYQVVVEPEGVVVGTVDEDFAVESISGSVFLLGTNSWRVKRVEQGRVRVTDAKGAAPDIPFWLGEAPARTKELSESVSRLREEIADGGEHALALLTDECGLDRLGAEQAIAYVQAGRKILGVVPSQSNIVTERFFDESGGMQLVIHSPFGARVNKAWGLALRKRFCRSFNFELQAAATDNGIVLSLTEQHAFPLELVFEFLKSRTVEEVLKQAMLASPMFTVRWRWNLARALGLLRFMGGRKVPPNIQRMRAEDILASVFPDQVACAENLEGEIRVPDHPLVNETISNCLHEAMDINTLRNILDKIEAGEIRTVAVDTPEPSFFCHEILNSNPYTFLDDAPLEERRTRAVQLRRTLSREDAAGVGVLDATAIEQVVSEAAPDVRNADELHDALLTFHAMPPREEWRALFDELVRDRRAQVFAASGRAFWVPAERADVVRTIYAGGSCIEIIRGWMEHSGPMTGAELAEHLALRLDAVDQALAQLETEGQVMRGAFRPGAELEWCNRRLLARIHRLTIQGLRREIEPVSTTDFMRFLFRWQHVAPGTQLHGTDGVLQIIRQLQGYEIPSAAWEFEILPRRVHRYEPELLDQLCLSGEVMWGRLSPHPAFESSEERRRVRPTRVAPLTLFLREDADWLLGAHSAGELKLSNGAQDVLKAISTRGASFFADLVRSTGLLASQVEDALWELVAAGLLTADGFENLRSLIDPKRRRGEGHGRLARPRHAAGRWALLRTSDSGMDPARFADQLLNRWGIVCRDLAMRETLAPAWRDLLVILRRKEAQGEIRGGRFVASLVGEQFARPEAVDLLRHVRRSEMKSEEIRIAAADPLNLTGVILPGARATAPVLYRDGVPQVVDPEAARRVS